MMNRKVFFRDWDLTEYAEAHRRQKTYFDRIKNIKIANKHSEHRQVTPNYLFLTQHPHVYTLGKSGKQEHLLASEDELRRLNARFIPTDRGGDITYHGPGQLVAYPIVDLDNFGLEIISYIRLLEDVIIDLLETYGLEGQRSPGETGVWLDAGTSRARKICAIGVRTSRWVTMHGLALNIDTDLSYFDRIIPCGIRNKGVTSLEKELGYAPARREVTGRFMHHFARRFGAELVPLPDPSGSK